MMYLRVFRGSTALYAAVSRGDAELVHFFLSRSNVFTDLRDRHNQGLLHIAVEIKSEAVVQLLLATSKFDIDASDDYGRTRLTRAMEKGGQVIIRFF